MKALLLSVLILTVPGFAHGQSFIHLYEGDRMPSGELWLSGIVADSAYFEITKGRSCENAIQGLKQENLWLDSVRMAQDEEISLYQDVIESQNRIIIDWPKEVRANAEICEAEKERLKVKIRRLWRVVVTEAGVIAVIVIVLL